MGLTLWFIAATGEGGGATKCNLTGRWPFFKNLNNPFRKRIYILIPCLGIFRLQSNRKTKGKAIAYCYWKKYPFVLIHIVITRFGISDQFSCLVQEFMLRKDTLKNGTSRLGLYGAAPPPPPGGVATSFDS